MTSPSAAPSRGPGALSLLLVLAVPSVQSVHPSARPAAEILRPPRRLSGRRRALRARVSRRHLRLPRRRTTTSRRSTRCRSARSSATASARKSAASTAKNARSSRCTRFRRISARPSSPARTSASTRHGAFDLIGIVRADLQEHRRANARARPPSPSSSLPTSSNSNAAKNAATSPRQIDRKLLEIAIAIRLESSLEKDEILEAYINQINWGRQIKGVGEASRIYFEKHPSELTLSQSALLAGIVRGPDSFNPFSSMEAATRERNTTLERMVTAGAITRAEADAAKAGTHRSPAEMAPRGPRILRHGCHPPRSRSHSGKGEHRARRTRTSPPPSTSASSRKARRRSTKNSARSSASPATPTRRATAWHEIPGRRAQGARIHPGRRRRRRKPHRSRARRRRRPRCQRIPLQPRHPGRQAPARLDFQTLRLSGRLRQGPAPGHRRSATARSSPAKSRAAAPGDRTTPTANSAACSPVSYGLIRSRNTMSVRVGNYAGIPKVKEVARMAGFTTPMPENPSSFLGSWEASPWEVATAYTIFPNDGVRFRPYLISEIKDRDGNVLYSTLAAFLSGRQGRLRLVGFPHPQRSRHPRHRRLRHTPRLRQTLRRQNRHHQRFQGRLVRRLHLHAHLRRLGRLRHPEKNHPRRLRLPPSRCPSGWTS